MVLKNNIINFKWFVSNINTNLYWREVMNYWILISGFAFVVFSFSILFNYKSWVTKKYGESKFVISWKRKNSILYFIFGILGVVLSFNTIQFSIRKIIAYILGIVFILIVINNIILKKHL